MSSSLPAVEVGSGAREEGERLGAEGRATAGASVEDRVPTKSPCKAAMELGHGIKQQEARDFSRGKRWGSVSQRSDSVGDFGSSLLVRGESLKASQQGSNRELSFRKMNVAEAWRMEKKGRLQVETTYD